MTSPIEGLAATENREVLETLWEIIESPDNIYEHVWSPGNIFVWDNLSPVHARYNAERFDLVPCRATRWPKGDKYGDAATKES